MIELRKKDRRQENGTDRTEESECKKQFEELQSLLERAMALQTSMVLFEWDDETLAPKGAAEHTARVIGSLSEQYQEILASMRFKELLDVCQKAEKENAGVFDEVQSAILREAAEEQERLSCIPPEEYRAYAELTARATGIWTRAREKMICFICPCFEGDYFLSEEICGVPGKAGTEALRCDVGYLRKRF